MYRSRGLERAALDTPLQTAAAQLSSRQISALPIVDARGSVVGVLSRSDLVHHARLHGDAALAAQTCGHLMTQGPLVVEPTTPLRDAARIMMDHRIHRVFVVEAGALVGVLSTKDLSRAVLDARVETPLATIMTPAVATIRVDQPLSLAMEWLDRAQISGLIVVENEWPVGVFTQIEALAARGLAPATPIDELYDAALLCLPAETPVHRAAAQCWRMDVRRIVVSRARDFVGVVSGLDFAAVVAGA